MYRRPVRLCVGSRAFSLGTRPLVLGLLDTPRAAVHDDLLAAAERLVADGADLLGLVAPPSAAADEVPAAVAALAARFDVAVAVSTARAAVAEAALGAGAVVADDPSGAAGPDWLAVAAASGATVVLPHRPGRAPDADGDVVASAEAGLLARAEAAQAAGIPPERIVLDAGLHLVGTPAPFLAILRGSSRLARLGYPLALSPTPATVAAVVPGRGLEVRDAALAAIALGVAWGCRLVRTTDVRAARRVCDAISAVLDAA